MKRNSYSTRLLLALAVLLLCGMTAIAFVVSTRSSQSEFARHLMSLHLASTVDTDSDGINDYADIVQSARAQIGIVTSYDTDYYAGGYPPDNTGACADVIWRALQGAGYNFKTLIDGDMAAAGDVYPNTFDANINFRRTQNIQTYLARHTTSLTLDVIPSDEANLMEWQGGDIVTFAQIPGGLWHIAIVSDRRQNNGVPYLLHNHGYGTTEDAYLTHWPTAITGHYRFFLH